MSGPFGDLDRLVRHLDARLAAHPSYADLRNLRALARVQSGDARGVREDLEAALGVNPDYQAARFNLAWALLRDGEAAVVGRATDLARPLPAAWRRHLETVRIACAGEPQRALESLPAEEDGDAWPGLARVWLLVVLDRIPEAGAALQRVIARDADLPSILHTAGVLVRGAIDADRLREWSKSYAGNPHAGTLCQPAAELAHAAGDVDGSRRTLAWGVALNLDLGAYWSALGTQYESLGEEHAALVAMRRAVQVDPEQVAPRIALGYLFAARGLLQEAITQMEAAARLAPSYADVRYQLGLLYSDAGRSADAERELRAALHVKPSYVLANLALGCLLDTAGRNEEALEMLQSVRRSGLRSADLEARLAALHARLGHRNQARRANARARATDRKRRDDSDPPG
jgi:tetratricopeptide (TPR) repeat protein